MNRLMLMIIMEQKVEKKNNKNLISNFHKPNERISMMHNFLTLFVSGLLTHSDIKIF